MTVMATPHVLTLLEVSTVPATLALREMESTALVITLAVNYYVNDLPQILMSVHCELTTVTLMLNVLTLLEVSVVPATLTLREMESTAQV